MLRIGICDDSAEARDALHIQLEKVLIEDVEQVVYEFSSGSGAVRWLKNHPGEIDLLFLDVEMPELSGMEAAERIREFDTGILMVFVTGYAEYVFDGYRVGALDYIVKPVETGRLLELLQRVRRQLSIGAHSHFTLKNTDGIFRFAVAEISYFYSDKRKVMLVHHGREYPFYGKLDEVEEKLKGLFVRIHQRYLVNSGQIEHIGSDFVVVEERTLPVSRSMKEQAMAKLARAMLEEKMG